MTLLKFGSIWPPNWGWWLVYSILLNMPINYHPMTLLPSPTHTAISPTSISYTIADLFTKALVSSSIRHSYWRSSYYDFGHQDYHCAYSCRLCFDCYGSNSPSEFGSCSYSSNWIGYWSLISAYSIWYGLSSGYSSSIRIDPDVSYIRFQGCFQGFYSSQSVYFDHRGRYCFFGWSLVYGFWFCLWFYHSWNPWVSRIWYSHFGLHFGSQFGSDYHLCGTNSWAFGLASVGPSSKVDSYWVPLPHLWSRLPLGLWSLPFDSNLDCSGPCSAPIRAVNQLFGILWIQVWNISNCCQILTPRSTHWIDTHSCSKALIYRYSQLIHTSFHDQYSTPSTCPAYQRTNTCYTTSIHIRSHSWVSSVIHQLIASITRLVPAYTTTSCSKTTSNTFKSTSLHLQDKSAAFISMTSLCYQVSPHVWLCWPRLEPLAALLCLVWLCDSVLFEPIRSTAQRECQPRGQCASSGAPDTLVVNAVGVAKKYLPWFLSENLSFNGSHDVTELANQITRFHIFFGNIDHPIGARFSHFLPYRPNQFVWHIGFYHKTFFFDNIHASSSAIRSYVDRLLSLLIAI